MSDTDNEPDVNNEFSYVDYSSSRPFDEKVAVLETCFKRNLTRDQIIASIEKEVRKLTEELPLIRQDIAEGFGNLRKNDEQTERKVAAPLSITGCEEVHKPSINTRRIAVNEPGKTFDVENSDVVALKLGIDSVVTRLEQAHKKTVDDYEQKIRNKDQDLECMRTRMQALEETVAKKTKDIEKLREKIMDNELEIGKLELSLMNVKTKEQDVKNLKELLQSADVKLQARAKQMEQMGERFTQRITEIITVNDVKQTVNVQAVADLVKTVIVASSTDKMDNIERVPNTSEIVESEIPVRLKRLKQLYKPMSEKLLAKQVAAKLFQDDVLSLAELEKVQCSHTLTEAAECLIGLLLSKGSDVSYNCFLTALEATDQGHIVLWLAYEEFDSQHVDSQHVDMVRQIYTFLLEHLDLKDSGLTALLFQEKLIDQQEKEFLESVGSAVCQAERLLALLCRKSMKHFEQFLMALDRTEQGHVANELRRLLPFSGNCDTDVSDASFGHMAEVGVAQPGARRLVPATSTTEATSDGVHDRPIVLVDSRTTTEKAGKTLLQKFFTPRSKSVKATIAPVIAPKEDRKGDVRGLTVHGDELFIVRIKPEGHIEVYSASTFTFKHNIKVKELERSEYSYGLTSCDSNNCLYVSYHRVVGVRLRRVDVDAYGAYIARVEMTGDNKVLEWKVKPDYCILGNGMQVSRPHFESPPYSRIEHVSEGLSVNSEHNLLVTCSNGRESSELIEYTTHGDLVREILLQGDIKYLHHAIQLNRSQYLVSHGYGDRSVCVVDANGGVLLSYGNKFGSKSGQLNCPQQLAVDRNGFIFVADRKNNRIVVLDSELKWSRDLQRGGGGGYDVKQPWSLYLDEQRNLLFVGEVNGVASRIVKVTL